VGGPRGFGDLLRAARLGAGLSQEALAEAAGLSARAVSDLERGVNRAPRRDTLEALAGALRLSSDERAAWHGAWRAARDVAVRAPEPLRGNLPTPPNALIGRESEVEALVGQFVSGGARLVTVTGPGGAGKTRLAMEAARRLAARLPDGAWMADLAPLGDPSLVPATIAKALGVRDVGGRPILDSLMGALRERELLLLLDNCEHLLAAAPGVAALLEHAPRLRIVATSRERLRLAAERELPLGPLAGPGSRTDPAELARAPACALFVERARAVNRDFALSIENAAAVADICRRLDGLPLALELAAVWVKVLPPEALLPRLEHSLALLTGGARDLPGRQRTLRATIAWSYDLLTPAEQALFRRLATFVGSWSFDAAEVVGLPDEAPDADVLSDTAALLEKSLVREEASTPAGPRFRMLETLREFGLEQLVAHGEVEAARRRHAAYYRALAEEAVSGFEGPEHASWFRRLEEEQGNLRAAHEWCLERGEAATGFHLTEALWWLQTGHGHQGEARAGLERALRRLGWPVPAAPGRTATRVVGQVLRQVMHRVGPGAVVRCREAERSRIRQVSRAYGRLVEAYWFANETLPLVHAGLRALNLAERAGPSPELARAYAIACLSAGSVPQHALAEMYGRRAVETARRVGNLPALAYALFITSVYRIGCGKWRQIQGDLEEAAGLFERLGNQRLLGDARTVLAMAALYQGRFSESGRRFDAVSTAGEASDNLQHRVWAAIGKAEDLLRRGGTEEALRLLEAALRALAAQPDCAEELRAQGLLAVVRSRRGEHLLARQAAQRARSLIGQLPTPTAHYLLEGYAGVAETCLARWETEGGGPAAAGSLWAQETRQACADLRRFARVFRIGEPRAWLCHGTAEWLVGHRRRASAAWRKGLTAAERMGMPYEQARLHHEIGRHLSARDPAGADHLTRAAQIATQLGIAVEGG
jgi:predicted ATPase/transcriptional regulator with XRE-family HTH domain